MLTSFVFYLCFRFDFGKHDSRVGTVRNQVERYVPGQQSFPPTRLARHKTTAVASTSVHAS